MYSKILIIIILLAPSLLLAQGGSNYSIIGIGDINYFGNAAYAGVGGTSIAIPLENGINYRNPALWSMANNTRLQAGYRFSQNYVSNENNNLFQNNGNLNGFNAIFSIDTSLGLSAALGLLPYSNVNYLTATNFSVTEGDITVQGKSEYKGSGGINIAYFGGSTKIIDNLYVGASAYAAFGIINSQVDNLVYGELSNYSFNTRILSQNFLSGWGFKTGVFYKVYDGFSLGGFYEKMSTLQSSDSTLYYRPSTIGLSHTEASESSIEMPSMWGLGASFESGKFLIGADFAMQDFSQFNYNEAQNSQFGSSMYINLGVARFGSKDYGSEFLDKITYKFGFSYKNLYYQIAGEQINDISFSFGMGIPVPKTFQIDMGFTLGSRGTTSLGLVQEYYGQFNVDISIGEIWFKPFKREFD